MPKTKEYSNGLNTGILTLLAILYLLKVILCASEHICSTVRYCFRSFKQR